MTRRTLLKNSLPFSATVLAGCDCRNPGFPARLGEALTSLHEWSQRLTAGQLSAADLTRHYLRRIADLDKVGPKINAVIELNPDAVIIAKERDPENDRHGPLQGISILIKDNIDTADAMETTGGSLALLGGKKPERDAFIVTRLREAGAVILGKTNLSEWANIRSPNSTSGWSGRGGLTLNPVSPTHSASGSSSGSAAAVAAGFAAAAIGTETNGSIISPASACGIVGLKPTMGLVSRSGIIPITQWQDTAGPMTLTVRDAALMLNVIAGIDPRDKHTWAADGHIPADYTSNMGPEALRGKRLGIVRAMSGKNEAVLALLDTAIDLMRASGAVIVDNVKIPNRAEAGALAWKCMLTDFRGDLNTYLQARDASVRSLAEVIAFNVAHRDQEMPWFAQEFFEEAEQRSTPQALAEAREDRARSRRLSGPEGIDVPIQEHGLDALICATNDPIGLINLSKGDTDSRCACGPSAVAGYPHLTVPMGFVEGLPVGISFFGAAWSEATLLACGDAFEGLMPVRREAQAG